MTAAIFTAAALMVGAPNQAQPTEIPVFGPVFGMARSENLAFGDTPAVSFLQALPRAEPLALPASSPEQTADLKATEPDGPDIVVRARRRATKEDPLAVLNEKSYQLTQAVDEAVIVPAMSVYEAIVPAPVADGIRNVLNNLRSPDIIVNFVLQHRIGKALKTVARFAINSTLGIGGIFDIARRKPFHLRHRPNGFADTLGYYGIKPGAFLYLPLIGPTTVRDLVGVNMDRFVLPLFSGSPFNKPYYFLPVGVFRTLDHRAQVDEHLEAIRIAEDPYATTRRDYLHFRQNEIDQLHSKAWRDRRGIATVDWPLNPPFVPRYKDRHPKPSPSTGAAPPK